MTDSLWYVTQSEAYKQALDAYSYGCSVDVRKAKKGLKTYPETVQRHLESYYFFLDLWTWKMMHGEQKHAPLWLIEPRWEQEKAYAWWEGYKSYFWNTKGKR